MQKVIVVESVYANGFISSQKHFFLSSGWMVCFHLIDETVLLYSTLFTQVSVCVKSSFWLSVQPKILEIVSACRNVMPSMG